MRSDMSNLVRLPKSKERFVYLKYFIVCALFMVALPLKEAGIIGGSVLLTLGSVLYYAVIGIGMNVLLGYSGLITLGGAGFMGLAAYLSACCTTTLGLPFILSLLISVSVPLMIGMVIGIISLRLEGYYLAIATLGISEILKQVFIEFEAFTNGFSGSRAAHPVLLGTKLTREYTFVFYVLILLVVLVLVHNLINSAKGRAFLTMRGSESAAQAMGINLLKHKITAFAISTVLIALGGVMYVHLVKFSYPSVWGLSLSLNMLAIVVIGGMRTALGPVFGALVVVAVPELILKQIPVIGQLPGVAFVLNGLLIIIVLMFYGGGVIGVGSDLRKLWNRAFKAKTLKNSGSGEV